MSNSTNKNSRMREHRNESAEIDTANLKAVEEALEQLIRDGVLNLPAIQQDESDLEYIEPSKKAQAIGNRVRSRILDKLGLKTLGSYLVITMTR